MSPWRLAIGGALCGAIALGAWLAVGPRDVCSLHIEITPAPIAGNRAASGAEPVQAPQPAGEGRVSVANIEPRDAGSPRTEIAGARVEATQATSAFGTAPIDAPQKAAEDRVAITDVDPRDVASVRAGITEAPIEDSQATSASGAEPIEAPQKVQDRVPVTDVAAVDADQPVAPPPAERPSVQLASLGRPDAVSGHAKEEANAVKTPEECFLADACVDQYLWSLYQRTPKIDAVKKQEQVKVTVTKKGKTRTVTKTVVKFVDEDFGWKDPKAAERAGMPLMNYVIGGMDRSFKHKLYRALHAMDDAGLEPGITSAFRDDYRQLIASGKKAASDSSYHGGSRRGGYGHGAAADLVSVKGETRAQRWDSTEALWKWIDAHEKELGIGRPYLDRDPPHVGAVDGKEFVAKRGTGKSKLARSETSRRARSAVKKIARGAAPGSDATKLAATMPPASAGKQGAKTTSPAPRVAKGAKPTTPVPARRKVERTASSASGVSAGTASPRSAVTKSARTASPKGRSI